MSLFGSVDVGDCDADGSGHAEQRFAARRPAAGAAADDDDDDIFGFDMVDLDDASSTAGVGLGWRSRGLQQQRWVWVGCFGGVGRTSCESGFGSGSSRRRGCWR